MHRRRREVLWMSRKMSTQPAFEPPPVQLATSRYAVSAFTADYCMGTRGLSRGQNGREAINLTLGVRWTILMRVSVAYFSYIIGEIGEGNLNMLDHYLFTGFKCSSLSTSIYYESVQTRET
jgi:hypothetical protein